MSKTHDWTYEEDLICCMEYLDFVFNYTGEDTLSKLAEKVQKQLPHIKIESLKMKIQNIKYIAMESGLEDRLSFSPLSRYSKQCKRAFADATEKFEAYVTKDDKPKELPTTNNGEEKNFDDVYDKIIISRHPEEFFNCFPIGAWEMEPGFTLVGERVKHNKYGVGTVLDYDPDGGFIKIDFDKKERKFVYPDAFESFLEFENSEYQSCISDYLGLTSLYRKRKRIRQNSDIKHDSIEDSFRYIRIEIELENMIVKRIGKGGYLGYCYLYWETKKEILKTHYGIDWKSPAELNPHIHFD